MSYIWTRIKTKKKWHNTKANNFLLIVEKIIRHFCWDQASAYPALSVTSLTLRATSAQGMDIRKAASCQRLSHPRGRGKITIISNLKYIKISRQDCWYYHSTLSPGKLLISKSTLLRYLGSPFGGAVTAGD
jgi:hypothetical protein